MGEVWSALVIPSAGRHDFYTGTTRVTTQSWREPNTGERPKYAMAS